MQTKEDFALSPRTVILAWVFILLFVAAAILAGYGYYSAADVWWYAVAFAAFVLSVVFAKLAGMSCKNDRYEYWQSS